MKKTSILSVSLITFRELRTFRSLQLFQEYVSDNFPNKTKKLNTFDINESNVASHTYVYSFYGNAEAISPIQRRRLRAEAAGVAKLINRSADQSAVIAKIPQQTKVKLSLFPTKRGSLLHAFSPFTQTRSLRKGTLLNASFIYTTSEIFNSLKTEFPSLNPVAFHTVVNQSTNTLTLLQSILFFIPTVVKGSVISINSKEFSKFNINKRPNRRFGGWSSLVKNTPSLFLFVVYTRQPLTRIAIKNERAQAQQTDIKS